MPIDVIMSFPAPRAAGYLAAGLHQYTYAAVLLGLILPQMFFQAK